MTLGKARGEPQTRGGPLFLIHLILKEKMKNIKVNFQVEISDKGRTTSSNMDSCTVSEHFKRESTKPPPRLDAGKF